MEENFSKSCSLVKRDRNKLGSENNKKVKKENQNKREG
jgi:hypothetical protein